MINTYAYDGEGRRVKKVAGTATTRFVYSAQGQLAAEYAGPETVSTFTTKYMTADHLGSTRVVTDAAGEVVARRDYLPFGEELAKDLRLGSKGYGVENDRVAQKFTGKERDGESGLDFFGARYLSSVQGRFTSPDPIKVTTGRLVDPQQFNLYAYTRNNPLRFVDPSGEILQLAGDVDAAKKQLCEILGTDDCDKRISYDEATNTLTVDISDINLAQNEGATLLTQLVDSASVYRFTLGDQMMTAGGMRSLTSSNPIANLTRDDIRMRRAGATDRPPAGIDAAVGINPKHASFRNRDSGRKVLLSMLIFHELAEAYAKVDLARQYASSDVQDVEGGMIVIRPAAFTGAHLHAGQREQRLRDQRPYLRESGFAGGMLIRDPKP